MTKKMLALMLSLLLALSLLTACSGGPVEETTGKEEEQSSAVAKDDGDAEEKELFGFGEGAEQEEAPADEGTVEDTPVAEDAPATPEMPTVDAEPAESESTEVSDAVDADYYVLAGTYWYYSQTEDVLVFHEDGTVECYNPETGAESTKGVFTWNEAAEEGTIEVGDIAGVMYFASTYLSVEAVDNAWFFEAYTGDLSEFN